MARRTGRVLGVLALWSLVLGPLPAAAEAFGGVDFPQGARSFADEVVSVETPANSGGAGRSPNTLGPPDCPIPPPPFFSTRNCAYSLGNGGSITLRFADNVLTGDGTGAADLYIFESGTAQENVRVEIAGNDGFVDVGQTAESQLGAIDIDPFISPGDRFTRVRLTDIASHRPGSGDTAGAEIDSVGAIATLSALVARDDEYATDEDTTLEVATPGVLGNDEGEAPLRVTDAGAPSNGVAAIAAGGALTYTPDPDFTGVDAFTYTIEDRDGQIASATVTVTVRGVDEDPVAEDDAYAADRNQPLEVGANRGVLANDRDPDGNGTLQVTDVTEPANGRVTVDRDGSFRYEPNRGFVGTDTFTYTVGDGTGRTDTATVTIDVSGEASPSDAQNDRYATERNTPLEVGADEGVLANDRGDAPLSVVDAGRPDRGTVEVGADGSFRYVPDDGFVGEDRFTYTVEDAEGDRAGATVRIDVGRAVEPAAARDDAYRIENGEPLTVGAGNGVVANDRGDGIRVVAFEQPDNGRVDIDPDGSLRFVPDDGFRGTATFAYTIRDDAGGESTATVTVEVAGGGNGGNGGNDGRVVARDDRYDVREDGVLRVDKPGVLKDDEAPTGESLRAEVVERPNHGSLDLDADGSFVYRPDEGFVGDDVFRYRATAAGGDAVARVTIRVEQRDRADDGPDTASAGNGGGSAANADGGTIAAGADEPGGAEFMPGAESVEPAPAPTEDDAPTGAAWPALPPPASSASVETALPAPTDAADAAQTAGAGAAPFAPEASDSNTVVSETPASSSFQPADVPDSAYPAPADCAGYPTWLDAQTALESSVESALAAVLDPDGDGIACEDRMA